MKPSSYDWVVEALLGVAQRLLPPERGDWATAMRAETDHVSEGERLRWAFGCAWTAVKLRLKTMNTGDYRVSRGVMLIEAIGAFGPLTLGWFEIVFGPSGVVRLSREIIDRYFLAHPGGTYILVMMFVDGVMGLIGPIGMILGVRYVLTGRGIASRGLGWVLAAALAATNLLGTATGMFWGPRGFQSPFALTILFVLLPAAVIVHLMWLARPIQPSRPLAATS